VVHPAFTLLFALWLLPDPFWMKAAVLGRHARWRAGCCGRKSIASTQLGFGVGDLSTILSVPLGICFRCDSAEDRGRSSSGK
jgi:hypothetical protein